MEAVKGYRAVVLTKDRIDRPQREVTGMVSTVEVDLIGDVMVPGGCDYSRLSKSVTIHHDDQRIVGTHRNLSLKSNGVLVRFNIGTGWPEADATWRMIEEEALTALSIEFIGKDYGGPTPAECKQYGNGARRIFRKWYLDGYSLVGKPCNPGAQLLEAKARVDDWLEREVRAGRVRPETAANLGLPVQPAYPREPWVYVGPSGAVCRVVA